VGFDQSVCSQRRKQRDCAMNHSCGRGITHVDAETIERLHDIVVKHLVGHNRKHRRHIRRRFFENYVGTAVDRNKRASRGGGNTERKQVATPAVFERAAGKDVAVARCSCDRDFDLNCRHLTFPLFWSGLTWHPFPFNFSFRRSIFPIVTSITYCSRFLLRRFTGFSFLWSLWGTDV